MSNNKRVKPGGLRKFLVTDREECGLIIEIEDDSLLYVVKVPNRATHPNDYVITKDDFNQVESVLGDGEKIVGFVHTHLAEHDCAPSDTDFDGAEKNPGMLHLIYHPSTKEHCWYGAVEEVTTN